ncbi:MAG: metallophosphoesterase family protein [Promethearchaeota archaeon]
MADTHLGFRQYKLKERFRDFNASFENILNFSLQKEVDFILLAGDMFQNSNIKPDTLSAVYQIIISFKEKCRTQIGREIPILAIQGNHDKSFSAHQVRTWMEFLADLDLIKLIQEIYDPDTGNLAFDAYSEEEHIGGYYEFPEIQVRVYGMQYRGAVTSKFFPLIAKQIPVDPDFYQILMMHFGIEGKISNKPGIVLPRDFLKMREKVNYLATGHYHKQYVYPENDPWLFNPGSTEVNDAKEVFQYDIYERCIFYNKFDGELLHSERILFDIHGNNQERHLPNRNFVYIGPFNLSKIKEKTPQITTWEKTMDYVEAFVKKKVKTRSSNTNFSDKSVPILLVSLEGSVPYSRLEIDYQELKNRLQSKLEVLHVKIYGWLTSDMDGISISPDKEITIDEIEDEVFTSIIDVNKEYANNKESIFYLSQDIKEEISIKAIDYEKLVGKIELWYNNNMPIPQATDLSKFDIGDEYKNTIDLLEIEETSEVTEIDSTLTQKSIEAEIPQTDLHSEVEEPHSEAQESSSNTEENFEPETDSGEDDADFDDW